MELYHLDEHSLHWNEGAKIVTAWQTLEEGDLSLSNGLDVPGRNLPSCSVSYLFSSVNRDHQCKCGSSVATRASREPSHPRYATHFRCPCPTGCPRDTRYCRMRNHLDQRPG